MPLLLLLLLLTVLLVDRLRLLLIGVWSLGMAGFEPWAAGDKIACCREGPDEIPARVIEIQLIGVTVSP